MFATGAAPLSTGYDICIWHTLFSQSVHQDRSSDEDDGSMDLLPIYLSAILV